MVDITDMRNIAADASWILENRLRDKRRAEPFMRLADRFDDGMPADLGAALTRVVKSLSAKHPDVAEEIQECVVRWNSGMTRR
jgi:hypothetical protein